MAVKIDYSVLGDIVSFQHLDSEPCDSLDLLTEMPHASMIVWIHPQSTQWVRIECLNWGATPIGVWMRHLTPYLTLSGPMLKTIQHMRHRGLREWHTSDRLDGYRKTLIHDLVPHSPH